MRYPVVFSVPRPPRFERLQLLVRVLALVVLSLLGWPLGWIFGLLYLALPLYAAVAVSQRDGDRFLAKDGPSLTAVLRWIMAAYAYLALVTDRFPTDRRGSPVRLEVAFEGRPTVGSALLRLLYGLPLALVLAVLAFVAGFVWLLAAIFVLVREQYPEPLHYFLAGVTRFQARLLVYQASLVAEYPPLSLAPAEEPTAPPSELPVA